MPPVPSTPLRTHEVLNQPPPLQGLNLYTSDLAMVEAVAAFGTGEEHGHATAFGEVLSQPEVQEAGRLANVYPPVLKGFDRYGHRLDEVEFHPGYHTMMSLGMAHEVHSLAWNGGTHVGHAVLEGLLSQVEPGVCCPLTMTYAVVPALRHQPELAAVWEPRARATAYDPRMVPADQKTSATLGMAMTEKQGGSDVRANTTVATTDGDAYRLTGHKWFCSAPMCDAFLTLAQLPEGLTCFLVPRWLPDGSRNRLLIQRLKDKVGNRSNASSEIEYDQTYAQRVGAPGRGVRTIVEMVHHTRLDCTLAAGALGRAALVQAVHHARHRNTFGKRLITQPLMKNVLADLALEVEASTWLGMWVAHTYDRAGTDPEAAALARIAVAVAKYWTNKRCPTVIAEAMECLGGVGYTEETPLARLYREAPLNGIWEGSGNVICLDVLRAAEKEPESLAALLAFLDAARGTDEHLDAAIEGVHADLEDTSHLEYRARSLVETLALTLQGVLLTRYAPSPVAEAFLATRLQGRWGHALGTLPTGLKVDALIDRVGLSGV